MAKRLSLIVALWFLLAWPATGWAGSTLQLSDTSPRQGSLVRVTLAERGCSPVVTWHEEEPPLYRTDSEWVGYLGVGLETDPGSHLVEVRYPCDSLETTVRRTLTVRAGDYPVQRLTVDDTGKVELSEADLRRHRREASRIRSVLNRRTPTKYWRLPFHAPIDESKFQPGESFGSRRVINGHKRSPHSGEDYTASKGDPVYAINNARVVLTGDFFFSGRGVFLDHGHGLFSMYFHLSEIDVEEGDTVRAGQRIGAAGATGRVTGPHLHLGIELRGHRVNPDLFFFDSPGLFSP